MLPPTALARLSVSVQFDWRLAPYDLLASGAHARVLHKAGLLDDRELSRMLGALEDLSRACRDGSFRPHASDEDVHTALERGLLERLGSLGGKLRAGRSRNDQVATDLRLYLRDHVRIIVARLAELETALMEQAQRHLGTPAPGFTHMQHAQPVLLAHQLLAHVQAFARDAGRLRDWDKRAAVSPLGAGALAGSSLPLDPEAMAAELGFDSAADNLRPGGLVPPSVEERQVGQAGLVAVVARLGRLHGRGRGRVPRLGRPPPHRRLLLLAGQLEAQRAQARADQPQVVDRVAMFLEARA